MIKYMFNKTRLRIFVSVESVSIGVLNCKASWKYWKKIFPCMFLDFLMHDAQRTNLNPVYDRNVFGKQL